VGGRKKNCGGSLGKRKREGTRSSPVGARGTRRRPTRSTNSFPEKMRVHSLKKEELVTWRGPSVL